MANDFGLPSLNINHNNRNDALNLDAMKISEVRKWENMIHPYILFNHDRQTVTFKLINCVKFTYFVDCFKGTYLDRRTRKFRNPNILDIIENVDSDIPIISSEVLMQLLMQRVKIFDNFNTCIREQKLITLCHVMGLSYSIISQTDR